MNQKRASRAQQKRDLHAHYHAQQHNFFNHRQASMSGSRGGGKTKTKSGVGFVQPLTKWFDSPINKVLHDNSRPTPSRADLRAMRHGTYQW